MPVLAAARHVQVARIAAQLCWCVLQHDWILFEPCVCSSSRQHVLLFARLNTPFPPTPSSQSCYCGWRWNAGIRWGWWTGEDDSSSIKVQFIHYCKCVRQHIHRDTPWVSDHAAVVCLSSFFTVAAICASSHSNDDASASDDYLYTINYYIKWLHFDFE